MTSVLAAEDLYADQFEAVRDRLPGADVAWVRAMREAALARFLELGFPTTKMENWKYTNVAPIRRIAFEHVLGSGLRGSNYHPLPPPKIGGGAAIPRNNLLADSGCMFINGVLDHASNVPAICMPLSSALSEPGIDRYLTSLTTDHAFAALNTALFTDGVCLIVPPGVVVKEPVHAVFASTRGGEPWACYPRNLIVAGEGAQVTFIESFPDETGAVYFNNSVTQIFAGPGAVVDYCKVQREASSAYHVGVVDARLERDASLTSHSITFGSALVRNDLNVALDGEGSHCTLNGLFAVDGRSFVDNHTVIDHRKPHASSRELYKGVLAGRGEGVFNGAIIVREDAQKTDAVQHSKNLLLSEHAQINTKPQLEIRANDVRCFHGASVGQIDPDAMFYLKSRGLDETHARRVLVRGFASEILNGVRVPELRGELEQWLTEWFEGLQETA